MNKINTFINNSKLLPVILFTIVILFSLFFRVYKITDIPPSLNWDEISHGYNAYSILSTGRDEWGISFPLIFRAYGDYKLPLYIYLTVLNIALFGLNSFSIRLVSVLSGVGIVIVSYLITRKITKNIYWSIFSAFLAGISPWSLFLSRIAVEANLCAFLFSLGIYFLLGFIEKKKSGLIILTGFLWGLSLFTYNSARIIVPIFTFILFCYFVKTKEIKKSKLFFIIIAVFLILMGWQILGKSASARYNLVSLIDQGAVNQINQLRSETKLPNLISRIFYNKATFFVYLSTKNYLSNLNLKYLFFNGGSQYQFSMPDHGILFLITAPFLIMGLVLLFLKKDIFYKILICWFLLSIIPSAVTRDAPHVLRTLLILPLPFVLTTIGLKYLVDWLRDKSIFKGGLVIGVVILAVIVSFAGWWSDYLKIYPAAYSWAWQYGYSRAVDFVQLNKDKYDKIIFSKRYGEPHEFILFYSKYDPGKYQSDKNKKWDYHANWYWVDGFDKYMFINDWEIRDVLNIKYPVSNIDRKGTKLLLVTSPGNYPEGWKKLETINFLDGKPAFEILENEQI